MHGALIVGALLVTAAAAVRSTWSPCGRSMLSTITPLSQHGRGHSYRATVAWFILGSTVGGATVGAVMLVLSWGGHALSLTADDIAAIVVAASLLAALSDLDIRGHHLPRHHRQVNERWLDTYRPWVYGAGFGWQIGTGLATYIMTAAVYLVIFYAALAVSPALAFALWVLFGLLRGSAVLLGRRITSAEALRAIHQRFERTGGAVRRATIAAELVSALVVAWAWSPAVGLGVTLTVLIVLACSATATVATRQLKPARPPAAATRPARP
jgi:hypothetical protein